MAFVFAFLLSCQEKKAVKVSLDLPVSSQSLPKAGNIIINDCTTLSATNNAAGVKNVYAFVIVLFAAVPLMLMPRFQKKPGDFFVIISLSSPVPLFLYNRNIRV